MNRFSTLSGLAVGALSILSIVGTAHAVNYSLNWLSYAPTAVGSSVPNNSVFNLPGVGNVTVSYTIPSFYTHARFQNPIFFPGSVTSGPDTYSWATHEAFSATANGPVPAGLSSWDITYTFQSTLAPGSIILGVQGLGSTNQPVPGTTVASVLQNGTFLGDFISGQNFGATQFNPGVGQFSMQNSVTGPGGQNPHWNTELGLVRIMDPISSLTVRFAQMSGDGVGVNIASFVPTPGAASLGVLAGLVAMRRRRTS